MCKTVSCVTQPVLYMLSLNKQISFPCCIYTFKCRGECSQYHTGHHVLDIITTHKHFSFWMNTCTCTMLLQFTFVVLSRNISVPCSQTFLELLSGLLELFSCSSRRSPSAGNLIESIMDYLKSNCIQRYMPLLVGLHMFMCKSVFFKHTYMDTVGLQQAYIVGVCCM